MTAHFTVAEVLDATGGRLVGKAPETPFTGVSTDSRSLTSGQLFSQSFIQFEFISLLLLVAIASALVLAKRKVD